MIDKKQMTEEDIKLNFITPVFKAEVGRIKLQWKQELSSLMER